LHEQLVGAGHRVSAVDAVEFAAGNQVAEAGDDNEIALIVIEAGEAAVEQASHLISLMARVAGAAAQRQIPLWLITCGAQQSVDSDDTGLVGAALWGFGRVLMHEIPRLSLRLIDLAPTPSWAERADRIASELADGFAGPTFGLECAGIVRAVGAGVADLAVGDRVTGFAPAALSTQVTTAAHAVTRIPLETSFAAAATIPVVFVTAVYALGTL